MWNRKTVNEFSANLDVEDYDDFSFSSFESDEGDLYLSLHSLYVSEEKENELIFSLEEVKDLIEILQDFVNGAESET